MRRTLVVTNDFPPRAGGIQAYVHELAIRQPPGSLVVFASTSPGAAGFDAAQPFPVVRQPTGMLLPTPEVARRVREVARAEGCTAVWFGAAAPLALLAAGLRRSAGVERVVAATHGHEVGWAAVPGGRRALRRIGVGVDAFTYLGEYTRARLQPVLGDRMERLPPGVDPDTFHPSASGAEVRRRHRLGDRPTVVCVSRLVPRKGQDTLIRAWPAVRRQVPDAVLLVVGQGRDLPRLRRLVAAGGLRRDVVFTGGVPWAELPAHYAAGHVFAMPCRTRRGGLDVEGLGIVYLEASATGLPVLAGDSGGAPDAVLPGETGWVVPGRSVDAVADRLVALLTDPAHARAMGEKGRAWVERDWRWDTLAARLHELLQG